MRSLARWRCPLLLFVALPVLARDYRFDGSMSEEVLRNYLSRSMTTMYLLTGHGDFNDNLRMLTNCGVKFAGRDHPDKAIDHYKNSWKNAIAA